MKLKPHKCQDQAYQELMALQEREGKLKLMHFRRVKQLGAGDVGLVDLVQLQVRVWDALGTKNHVHVLVWVWVWVWVWCAVETGMYLCSHVHVCCEGACGSSDAVKWTRCSFR